MSRLLISILILFTTISCSEPFTQNTILDDFIDHEKKVISLEIEYDKENPQVEYGQLGYRISNSKIYANYDDGTREDVTLDAVFSGLPFLATGQQTFSVSFKGLTITEEVNVSSLEFVLKPRTVDYNFYCPDEFDDDKVFVGWEIDDPAKNENAIPQFPIINMHTYDVTVTPKFVSLSEAFQMEGSSVIKSTTEVQYEFYGIPSSVTGIANNAFSRNSVVKAIAFEKDSQLEYIGEAAFYLSSLMYIEIPASVKTIEKLAFCSASNLKGVYFEENSKLETIGNDSFSVIGVKEFNIPGSVKTIGRSAFGMNFEMEKVVFEKGFNATDMSTILFDNDFSLKEIIFIEPASSTPFNGYESRWGAPFSPKVIWNGKEI